MNADSEIKLSKYALEIMNISLKRVEKDNKIPEGYLTKLLNVDSDWDFIVKIGLILEGLLCFAIETLDGKPLSKTQQKNPHSQRLKKALDDSIITIFEYDLLIEISSLRNAYIHNLENLNTSISKYFSKLEYTDKQKIVHAILNSKIPQSFRTPKNESEITTFPDKFRTILLCAIYPTILNLGCNSKHKKNLLDYTKWREKKAEQYGEPLPPQTEGPLIDRYIVMNLVEQRKIKLRSKK